jgi:hypothetical protein
MFLDLIIPSTLLDTHSSFSSDPHGRQVIVGTRGDVDN